MVLPHLDFFFFFIFTGPSCKHIKKGTDQTLLKKLYGISDWTSCQDCEHEVNKENNSATLPQESEEDNETANIWMCLKCGHRVSVSHVWLFFFFACLFLLNYQCHLFYKGCGRNSEDKHAIKHYETPRSDPHCLVVSMDSWSVW